MQPSDLGLPEKFTGWRPNQLELAAKIAASSRYGYLLDSPTGTGKSLVAATAQRILQKNAVYLCLAEHSTVWTSNGFKSIRDVEVGELVQVGPSQFESVTDKGFRRYHGTMVTIRTAYKTDEDLTVSGDHEVLVVRGGGCRKHELPKQEKVMVQAKDVNMHDWLVYPVAIGGGQHGAFHDDFIELCAWYVAEGWPGGNSQIFFGLSNKETKNIDRLSMLLKTVSRGKVCRSDAFEGAVVLYVRNPVLRDFLELNFGHGAINKHLPSWLFKVSSNQQELFLNTFRKGDGSLISGQHAKSLTVEIGTSSRELALQTRLLAMQCGYLPTISTRDYKPGATIMGRIIKEAHRGYLIRYRGAKGIVKDARGVNDGQWAYLKVLRINRELYTGNVYDISVPSERFCTVSAMVHNCTTKQLQDQILHDFPYARTLKGRSNYVCLKYPKMFPTISAEQCTHTEEHICDRRGGCPYIVAKAIALRAPLAVLNTAYFLSEANYVGSFTNLNFLVIDELDALESQLMNFIQLSVTKKQLDRLNVAPPKFKTKFEAWVEWAGEMLKQLAPELDRLTMATEKSSDWGGIDVNMLRRKTAIARLVSKLGYFVREVDATWVPFFGEEEWTFKPTWVSKYATNTLWKHANKVLGMSATILEPRQLSSNIGLTYGGERTYEYKALPSPFPKENRPIYFEPCANIINKNMEEALPKLAAAVERVLEKHPNEKILCHVVSYRIRDYLMKNVNSTRLVSHGTTDRALALDKFKEAKEPKVLVSPSMERGVDLPGEECRVVIIAKVPYPDLGDPQINKRVHASKDGNNWYAHRTVSAIVQMSGRAVRSVDDWAATYILDEQFSRLYREWSNMFPGWYREAVIM